MPSVLVLRDLMEFWKYQANGNDFIIIDDREAGALLEGGAAFFEQLCHRKFGIGADGVLFLKNSEAQDFKMIYCNADGKEVSMCGNGARAMVDFYHNMNSNKKKMNYAFETKNGVYQARVDQNEKIFLSMVELYDEGAIDVSGLLKGSTFSYYLNTGVPHVVFEVENVNEFDLEGLAPKVRHDSRFRAGVNVNIFQTTSSFKVIMRTYERGVEGETLACGTGAMAVAISYCKKYGPHSYLDIESKGGTVQICFREGKREFSGDVCLVFQGQFLKPS